MPSKIEQLLTTGLLQGYAGSSDREKLVVGHIFSLETSDTKVHGLGLHHDQWIANRTGGGQEMGRISDGTTYTRLYGGGTIDIKALELLGLTPKDVTKRLKIFLQALGGKTRLFTPCDPVRDGKWTYGYKIIESNTDIPITVGREDLKYDNHEVFVHFMLLVPVE